MLLREGSHATRVPTALDLLSRIPFLLWSEQRDLQGVVSVDLLEQMRLDFCWCKGSCSFKCWCLFQNCAHAHTAASLALSSLSIRLLERNALKIPL